jgi:hypothetical protein
MTFTGGAFGGGDVGAGASAANAELILLSLRRHQSKYALL